MRTLNVFTFNELSDAAKEKAVECFRSYRSGYDFEYSEYKASLEAFAEDIGITIKDWSYGLDGCTVRFDFGDTLAAAGIDDELIELLTDIRENGLDAVHFDADADLLAYKPWYTDDGAKVIPLAYELDYVSYYDLTPEQREQVYQDRDGTGDEYIENEYFDLSGQVYCMADFMRIGDGGMADYGFIGVMGESNTSALYISLSDNSDFVNVVRVIG